MTTPSLFEPDGPDEPEPRPPAVWYSETSREAADRIAPVSGELRRRVYQYLRDQGANGATDQEIQKALQMRPSTECPRRLELQEQGLVVDSGKRRLTESGRKATVWVIAEHAPAPDQKAG